MEPSAVAENVGTLLGEVQRKRPSDAKGEFVTSVFLTSTMGPGVRVVLTKTER